MSYQISKIMVCMDLNKGVLNALNFATSLSKKVDCEVYVLHVLPHLSQEASQVIKSYIADNNNMNNFEKDRINHARSIIETKISLCDPNIISGVDLFVDDPVSGIIEHSKELDIDMIVMGARKKSLVESFGGSVVKKIIDRSSIPVVCIP